MVDRNKLVDLLNTELSADNMGNFTPNELAKRLVELNIVESATDMNCIVIESIQKALRDDDEFPIHYYAKDEPMSETGRNVEGVECLTDDYIANHLQGES